MKTSSLLIPVAAIGLAMALCSTAVGQIYLTVPGSFTPTGWWVDTGLSLAAGTQVTVTASGTWTPWVSSGYCGPDGLAASTGEQYYGDQFFNPQGIESAVGTFPLGALIGYAGTTPPMTGSYSSMSQSEIQNTITHLVEIGSSATFAMPYTGELFLGMNDDAFSAFSNDNSGSITAAITVVPEPSALAVLACGLIVFVYFSRRSRPMMRKGVTH